MLGVLMSTQAAPEPMEDWVDDPGRPLSANVHESLTRPARTETLLYVLDLRSRAALLDCVPGQLSRALLKVLDEPYITISNITVDRQMSTIGRRHAPCIEMSILFPDDVYATL